MQGVVFIRGQDVGGHPAWQSRHVRLRLEVTPLTLARLCKHPAQCRLPDSLLGSALTGFTVPCISSTGSLPFRRRMFVTVAMALVSSSESFACSCGHTKTPRTTTINDMPSRDAQQHLRWQGGRLALEHAPYIGNRSPSPPIAHYNVLQIALLLSGSLHCYVHRTPSAVHPP